MGVARRGRRRSPCMSWSTGSSGAARSSRTPSTCSTLGRAVADPDSRSRARAGAGRQQPYPERGAEPDLVEEPAGHRRRARCGRAYRAALASVPAGLEAATRPVPRRVGSKPRRAATSSGRGSNGTASAPGRHGDALGGVARATPARPPWRRSAMFPFALLVLAICLQMILLGVSFAYSGVAADAAARAVSIGNSPQAAVAEALPAGMQSKVSVEQGVPRSRSRSAHRCWSGTGSPATSASDVDHRVWRSRDDDAVVRSRADVAPSGGSVRSGQHRVHRPGPAGAGSCWWRPAGDEY